MAQIKTNIFIIIKGKVPRKPLLSKMVLRKKFNIKGKVVCLKACLCIYGNKQAPGIDYFKTFVLVIRYNTFCWLIVKAVDKDLEIIQINVNTVFLNPILKKEIFIKVSRFLDQIYFYLKHKEYYLRLNKLLYGLKQAL